MFKKCQKLEKRVKALEEFLGLTLDYSDPKYPEYRFQTSHYNMKVDGVLGELYAAHKKRVKN